MPKSDKSDTAVAAFGRFNPPTKGHLKLVNKLKDIPGDHYLFISHTQDAEKNPLDYDTKVSYAKKFFEGVHIGDKGCETIYDVLNKLKDMGYEHLVYVCGEDEYVPFGKIINEYNEKNKAFESVKIVQAGDREEDSEGTDGISATKVRELAKDGDYEAFSNSIPDRKYAKGLYNDLRSAMKLDEDVLDEIEPNDIDMADAKAISGPIDNKILDVLEPITNVSYITKYPAGLYKDPDGPTISVYVHNRADLVAVLDLDPKNANILGTNFEIMIVDYAMVATNYQRKNIGFTLYKDLITKAKYNIGAYKTQSPGAQLLWKKLFNDSEISLCASNDFSNKRGKVEIYPVVMGPDGNLAAKVKGKVVSLYGLGNTMGIIATVKGGPLDQKILGISKQVDEAHLFNYPYWGWISPVGEVFLPTRNDEGLHDHIIQHVTDGKIKSAERGMNIGWVRFFIELDDKSMHFQTINIDKVNFSKVSSKIKSIVNKHLNCSAFNFEWLPSLPMAYAKRKHIEEDDPTVFIKKVSNVLRMNEDIVHSEQVDEAHALDYIYWGWIDANGKIYDEPKSTARLHMHYAQDILIDISDPRDASDNFDHTDSYAAEMKVLNLGWVRFFLTPEYEMFFSVYSRGFKLSPTISTAIKQVLDRAHKLTNRPIFRSYNFENSIDRPLNPIEVADPDEFLRKLRNKMNEDIVHSKNGWTLFSKKTHKRLGGPYPSKEQAIKRERQVAYFKHMSENNIKTFKQFSEEQDDLQVDPKGDQEVLLEVTAPKEVKDNVTDGLDLRSKFNRGGNSDTIKTANKLLKEPFDESDLKNLLVKLTRHEKEKKTGWDDPEEPSNGFIAWMLLGGDAGKLWAEKSLSSTGKKKDPTVTEGVVDADNEYRLKHCVKLMNRIISEKKSDIFNSDTLQKLEELLLDIAEHDK